MSKEKLALVSVVMPSYNKECFIEQSVRSVIHQTYTNWELIIVDDCSTDSTREILQRLAAEEPRIRLVFNADNVGAAGARNCGIRLCQGDPIAFLDSDDIWYPEKLEKQLACMEESGADIAYCSYSMMDAHGRKIHNDYIVPEHTDYEALLKENVIGCSTVAVRADALRGHAFQPSFYHEDYILWLELLKKGCVAVGDPEVLVGWRHLEQSRSSDKGNSAKRRWVIYRRYAKLPLMKSLVLFVSYALAGIKKYRKSKKR